MTFSPIGMQAHQNYVMHTDQANKQFKKLVKKDKALTKQIEAQKSKIARCQARLISWKRSIAQNEKECRERNDALRRQKELIARHCQGTVKRSAGGAARFSFLLQQKLQHRRG